MSQQRTLLVLDYPGRRPEAHVRDLGLEEAGLGCQYLLDGPLPRQVDAWSYASELTEHAEPGCAVVSYCATAPLAVAAAAQLGGDTPLPLIMLDPSECFEYHIVNGYASMVRQIAGDQSEDGQPPLLDVAAGIGTPGALLNDISRDLTKRASRAMPDTADADDAQELLANLVGMYEDWLAFLLAVHHRPRGARLGTVLHVLSRHSQESLDWLGTGRISATRIDCERPELARSAPARRVITEFLDTLA